MTCELWHVGSFLTFAWLKNFPFVLFERAAGDPWRKEEPVVQSVNCGCPTFVTCPRQGDT